MTVVFVVLAVVLTVPVYAFAVRRLLGLRLSPLRAWIGGLIALVCASPIITAIGSSIAKHKGSWSLLPAAWFVILGVAIALLIGMLVLVIFELLVPSGTMPGPVYLVRAGRKRVRRVRRYSQIGRILVRRGMLPYLRGTRRTELHTRDGRAALARSLRLALEDGGVTFIKLGQVLATRRDLMPAEFVDELSGLQDDAAQIPWAEVEPVLDLDLRAEVEDVFASFDRTPLAAASIAQVHAATLDSGERVVVKVRRPDVDTVVAWDLDIVDRLAIRLERSTRWGRGVGAVDLSHGFAAALREELDLRIEAQNMTAVRAAAAAGGGNGSVRIPKPHQSLCTAHVLVMERLDGRALGTIMPGEQIGDRQVLARNLLDTMLREVMIEGVFHADPHPGNVLTASGAHRSGRLDLDDLQSEKSYSPRVYGTSKLCNILFTRELARRAPELKANCFHPGVVRTGFAKNENGIWKVIATLGAPFLRSPERGARSLVWLALSDDAAALTSEYIEDEKVVAPAPKPGTTTSQGACGSKAPSSSACLPTRAHNTRAQRPPSAISRASALTSQSPSFARISGSELLGGVIGTEGNGGDVLSAQCRCATPTLRMRVLLPNGVFRLRSLTPGWIGSRSGIAEAERPRAAPTMARSFRSEV